MGMGQNWVPLKFDVNTKNRLITFFQWSPPTEIPFDTSILTFYLAFYLTYIHIFWQPIWHSAIYSDILCGILFDIYSDRLSDITSGILSVSSEILCGRGPAGITLIQRLLSGSGRDHCDHELAVEVRRGPLWSWACWVRHCDQERRGLLCCSWGPAAEEEREKEKEEGHKA